MFNDLDIITPPIYPYSTGITVLVLDLSPNTIWSKSSRSLCNVRATSSAGPLTLILQIPLCTTQRKSVALPDVSQKFKLMESPLLCWSACWGRFPRRKFLIRGRRDLMVCDRDFEGTARVSVCREVSRVRGARVSPLTVILIEQLRPTALILQISWN